MFNAHLHLDRAGTYEATVELMKGSAVRDAAALTIPGKHAIIPMIHDSPLYEPNNLKARVSRYLDSFIHYGTTRADTVVDTTLDRVGVSALEAFQTLKSDYRGRLDLQIGAYSPLGFRDDDPARWKLLLQGAELADFIGLLPERDDKEMYPDHIGFKESCRRGISLALEQGKKIHIHVDQANHVSEHATEDVIEVMREIGADIPAHEPDVWLIHVISPSTYKEDRFQRLVHDLAELNVGIITCPSAAISMRQYRGLSSPTFNSIARVLEFLAAGVQVRIGSDNICDITSPMGTTDLLDEVFVLSNAIRFYDTEVLSKMAAGVALDLKDIERVKEHISEDQLMRQEVESCVA